MTASARGLLSATLLGGVLLLASLAPAPAPAAAEPCPNEAFRQGPAAALPDCRAFEMVTPPYKDGYAVSAAAIAPDGSRLLGNSLGSFAGAPGMPATRGNIGLLYELARGPAGWAARPLTPANPQFRGAQTFYGAGADLTQTLFSLPTAPVGQDDFWVRGPGAALTDVGPITPPADGPTVEPAPIGPTNPHVADFELEGASADLSHVVFGVQGQYAWNGDPTAPGERDLYEYVGAGNSEPAPVGVTGGAGSTELIGECGTRSGSPATKFNAVSADGETVFFTPAGESSAPCGLSEPAFWQVYARRGGAETVRLAERSPSDCSGPCATSPGSDALFAGASADGSRAFFLSTQQLTDQASEDATPGDTAFREAGSGCQQAQGSGCNLYLYDFGLPAGERLVAVSAGSAEPRVQGVVRTSPDGSHVYFVARGKLTAEPNAQGAEALAGANNLYLYRRGASAPGGAISFIAALAPSTGAPGSLTSADQALWGGVAAQDVERPAVTTPDGRFLVFQSQAQLTADDSSEGVSQVFEYDSLSGTLKRVSIGDGGFNDNGNSDRYPAEITSPGYTAPPPKPQPISVSDDGAYVFFSSENSLTPGMSPPVPGNRNVYEYHQGAVHLIYGASPRSVNFLGASASGRDAFFSTTDRLLPQDTDTQIDVYDARVEGGFSPPPPAQSCSGEACQGLPLAQPAAAAPASSSFAGPGNPKPAPKKHKGHRRHHKKKSHANGRPAR